MRERANICKYLDIPLQHANDNILKRMKRGITQKETAELIATIRREVPGIAIRTTMLVGFPGETEEDFEDMVKFVEEQKLDRLGVFTYSHEENTGAYDFPDDIPDEVKQERAARLMDVQESISYDINQTRIGNTYKVLFDRKEGQYFVGRTEFDSPEVDNEVLVDASKYFVRIGDFAQVRITDATEFDLFGEVV